MIYHVTIPIITGDMTIFPSEVESALRTHENVADASVFSIKTEHGLDLCGCAWVILKDKTRATSIDELRSVCGVERGMIEHIKFVNDFPTSENGKIVKIKMASLYKQELNIKT